MLDQKTIELKINVKNIKVRPKVTIGLPADKIIEMATDTLKGISKIKALGSVARNISERAECG
jgi:hypothetical protein